MPFLFWLPIIVLNGLLNVARDGWQGVMPPTSDK
jgi:hypothetical protein